MIVAKAPPQKLFSTILQKVADMSDFRKSN